MLARAFQYRFETGIGLEGHALGNLVIAALADLSGDFARGLELAGEYLGARGAVYPSTVSNVVLHGIDRTGAEIQGQAALASNPSAVSRVQLDPECPPPYPRALEVIREADVVVIGPGSLYTSVIPNFLVSEVADALRDSKALRVYVANVANLRGETGGLDAADHVHALIDHGLAGAIDIALVHEADCDVTAACDRGDVEPVDAGPAVRARIEELGVRPVVADLVDRSNPVRHALAPLCRALEGVIE